MTIYNMPNLSGGIDSALVSTASEVNAFIPLFLFFVYCVIVIGGVVKQNKNKSEVDLPMWSTLGMIIVLILSVLMTLKAGLMPIEILSVVIALTCLNGFWLFMTRSRNEI